MVDSPSMNGTIEAPPPYQAPALPDVVRIAATDANRIPSPGTLRTLKAQLGKTWSELMGPDADDADRFQTLAWVRLRRDHPELRWEDCDNVELIIEDTTTPGPLDQPTSSSATSPASVGSGG